MNPADACSFTTTPALASACKQYHTNFENMWSYDFYKQDLKVVVMLLLRINLATKRFFGSKKKCTTKTKQNPKAQKNQQRKGFLKQKMETLFELLIKYQGGKDRKLSCITRVIDTIFNPRCLVINETACSNAKDGVILYPTY